MLLKVCRYSTKCLISASELIHEQKSQEKSDTKAEQLNLSVAFIFISN